MLKTSLCCRLGRQEGSGGIGGIQEIEDLLCEHNLEFRGKDE